jgi:hypothetical protein
MPNSTFVEIPEEGPAQTLAALWRARYASLLALHIVVWCTAGPIPTDIATVLFCSRSSVYRTGRDSREGSRGWRSNGDGQLLPPVCRTELLPMLRRLLVALRKAPLQAYGGCRTCWSGATLALLLQDAVASTPWFEFYCRPPQYSGLRRLCATAKIRRLPDSGSR